MSGQLRNPKQDIETAWWLSHRSKMFLAAILALVTWPDIAWAIDQTQVVTICREYLASEDQADRERLAEKLAEYRGEILPVFDELSRRTYEAVEAGYHPERRFAVPELRKKHADDLLYFTVPKSYRPDRATGLIVFMHGGGKTSSRRAPRVFMNFPELGEEAGSNRLGDVFGATGMVAVGPSALWNEKSSYRWCLAESDEYLADVIAECKSRFNIDDDRVFLVGHSMGGFGAYHHAQRQPDRFAAVVVNAGSWSLGYLPMFRGTPLCIVQGARDARRGVRWHYTDVEYARQTDKLLTAHDLDHTYFEHDGKHAVSFGREFIAKYLQSAKTLRCDPYYPRVAIASPVGFKRDSCFPVAHNRWLTLNESVDGKIEYDELISNGADDFDGWRLRHLTSKRRGAAIDAVNRGDNTIALTTQNVNRFTVWLHPRMIDVAKPVTVVVNRKTRFAGKVKPSLVTALESYERRGDWGLIYPIKIELDERR